MKKQKLILSIIPLLFLSTLSFSDSTSTIIDSTDNDVQPTKTTTQNSSDSFFRVEYFDGGGGVVSSDTTTTYEEANMINYNLETGTTTYENFDYTSYEQKIVSSTSSLSISTTNEVGVCESYVPDSTLSSTATLSTVSKLSSSTSSFNVAIIDDISSNSLSDYTGVLNSVIGNDDRTKVSNTKTSPYLSTALIITHYEFTYSNRTYEISYRGTGALIAESALLTAAHCLYKDVTTKETGYDDGIDNLIFPNKIEVYAGLSSSSEKTSSYKYYALGTVVNIQKEYYESASTNYDWATIELDRDLGSLTGYMGFVENYYQKGAEIHTFGYPADKSNYTMWETYGTLTANSTYKYRYDVDTYGGQSGSPVTIKTDDSGDTELICAVHTSGNTIYNSGTKINTFIFHYLRSYRLTGMNYLSLSIVSKSSGTWSIKISNSSSSSIDAYYNYKMCYASDAENWKNLSHILPVTIGAKSYKTVSISENWFATTIVASYVKDNFRYIVYANELNKSTKTLTQYTNIISANA